MPSIQQAQAKALKTGFFDSIGSEKFINAPLNTLEAMLAEYAEEFITKASDNLNSDNSISSGNLEKSIRFQTKVMGRSTTLYLYVNDYYKFINEGVKGVKGNQNTPYKFKYINPSRSHVEAIRKWIRENGIKARVTDVKRYGATQQESKATDGLAYIIARSIKKKGITGTGFWSKAFDTTFQDFGVQMSKALGADIRIDLQKIVREIKKK